MDESERDVLRARAKNCGLIMLKAETVLELLDAAASAPVKRDAAPAAAPPRPAPTARDIKPCEAEGCLNGRIVYDAWEIPSHDCRACCGTGLVLTARHVRDGLVEAAMVDKLDAGWWRRQATALLDEVDWVTKQRDTWEQIHDLGAAAERDQALPAPEREVVLALANYVAANGNCPGCDDEARCEPETCVECDLLREADVILKRGG